MLQVIKHILYLFITTLHKKTSTLTREVYYLGLNIRNNAKHSKGSDMYLHKQVKTPTHCGDVLMHEPVRYGVVVPVEL
jgi:hypothetical protein